MQRRLRARWSCRNAAVHTRGTSRHQRDQHRSGRAEPRRRPRCTQRRWAGHRRSNCAAASDVSSGNASTRFGSRHGSTSYHPLAGLGAHRRGPAWPGSCGRRQVRRSHRSTPTGRPASRTRRRPPPGGRAARVRCGLPSSPLHVVRDPRCSPAAAERRASPLSSAPTSADPTDGAGRGSSSSTTNRRRPSTNRARRRQLAASDLSAKL